MCHETGRLCPQPLTLEVGILCIRLTRRCSNVLKSKIPARENLLYLTTRGIY